MLRLKVSGYHPPLPLLTGGVAFVTFTSSEHAQECLKTMPANNLSAKNPCFKGKKLKLDGKIVFGKEAPDPEDIKWENLEYTAGQQIRQWIWHSILGGLVVSLGTVILIICAIVQKEGGEAVKKAMSASIGAVVTMTTGAMTNVVRKLSENEKVHTVSEMKAVFVQRSVFLAFCLGPAMTIIIPFLTGQLRNGDFKDLIRNLMSILLFDIVNQCFQSLIVDSVDEYFKKNRGRQLRMSSSVRITIIVMRSSAL